MKNEIFREIVGTKEIKISNELKNGYRILKNKNKLLTNLDSSTGIKTGFTKKAGRCFVGSAKEGEMEVVCVLLNCGPMFEECQSLLDYALKNYEMVNLIEPYQSWTVPVNKSNDSCVEIYSLDGFRYPLSKSEKTNIHFEYFLPSELDAPIQANKKVGEINVLLENNLLFSSKFYTMKEVKSNSYAEKLKSIIEGLA